MKVHSHDKHKQYRCEFCNKTFNQQSYLTKHMIFHTGNNLYQCKWCQKTFTDSLQLIHHVSTEHDVRINNSNADKNEENAPIPCIICQKEFRNAPDLLLHLRQHVEQN